jgi:hypothetical protein
LPLSPLALSLDNLLRTSAPASALHLLLYISPFTCPSGLALIRQHRTRIPARRFLLILFIR